MLLSLVLGRLHFAVEFSKSRARMVRQSGFLIQPYGTEKFSVHKSILIKHAAIHRFYCLNSSKVFEKIF